MREGESRSSRAPTPDVARVEGSAEQVKRGERHSHREHLSKGDIKPHLGHGRPGPPPPARGRVPLVRHTGCYTAEEVLRADVPYESSPRRIRAAVRSAVSNPSVNQP